jgi:hypothetical protein
MTPAILTQAERIVREYECRPAPIIDAEDVRPLTNASDPLIGFAIFTACMFIAFCTFVGFVDVWHRVFG